MREGGRPKLAFFSGFNDPFCIMLCTWERD